MATYFFGVNQGAGIGGGTVTESATTTSKDVEVVLNTTANVPSKEELVLAIQKLNAYIVVATKNW
jgi:hypothetical protein